ncbi:MAG: sugar ABC transporter permease [Spirochaetaceae bacterium]|nr:MAG: sugar ABC transporter permease [Spirochaetaceae bacterium]
MGIFGGTSSGRTKFLRDIYRDRYLYLLFIPVFLLFFGVFRYLPMYGVTIAFKNFRLADGIFGSAWVGFTHFERLFRSPEFLLILRNTVLLNVYQLVFGFPIPILLAILINEMRHITVKRTVQSLLYIPHFISWVVMGGIAINVLSPSTGIVNAVLSRFGVEPIYFMTNAGWWPVVFITVGIWKSAGWGTIIYLAAISGIDPQLYEASVIDGAGKVRQTWHITLPGIRSTIAILLILNLGGFIDLGFEQIWVLQNPAVRSVAEVIPTYVYRIGLLSMQFSYTAALGLFQSLVGLVMIITANAVIRAMGENGLW